ncbi:hypothetical protein VNO78_08610 [Psophocarpus tetragonolobus]|uniref:Uncharacterized protein n=1 Tax=Psophocarpus tetragonolobus TaxID=3891 RepID=A0AAN9XT49_PSOTE
MRTGKCMQCQEEGADMNEVGNHFDGDVQAKNASQDDRPNENMVDSETEGASDKDRGIYGQGDEIGEGKGANVNKDFVVVEMYEMHVLEDEYQTKELNLFLTSHQISVSISYTRHHIHSHRCCKVEETKERSKFSCFG